MMSISHFESQFAKARLFETLSYRNFPIAESKSFIALPTIGSLVPGWVLVVPKSRTLALAGLPRKALHELEIFETEVRRLVESEFGDVAIFEHGPAKPASPVGCGVDHAHLHIVPIKTDLMEEAKSMFSNIQWESIRNLESASPKHTSGLSYLYLKQPSIRPQHFMATIKGDFPSQLLRRVIAKGLGAPDQWDWKEFPHTRNMKITCDRLAPNPIVHA